MWWFLHFFIVFEYWIISFIYKVTLDYINNLIWHWRLCRKDNWFVPYHLNLSYLIECVFVLLDIFLSMFLSMWSVMNLILLQACSAKKTEKNGHLFGFVPHTYFFFWTLLRVFLPRLEILFYSNHYFLVCIFKYRTSLDVNYRIENFTVFIETIFAEKAQKIEQQQHQQQQQRVGGVRSPNGIFTNQRFCHSYVPFVLC